MKRSSPSPICVSIAEPSLGACRAALADVAFAEIRLDAVSGLTPDDVRALFSSKIPCVATCRPGACSEALRLELLLAAVEAGARYVDVELEADDAHRKRVVEAARASGCKVIVSHHDYAETPAREALVKIVDACFAAGADVAKVACQANDEADAARLLGLLDDPRRLVVVGMGEKGAITRVAGPLLGGEFTFAALREGAQTAPGQLTADELERRMQALGEC